MFSLTEAAQNNRYSAWTQRRKQRSTDLSSQSLSQSHLARGVSEAVKTAANFISISSKQSLQFQLDKLMYIAIHMIVMQHVNQMLFQQCFYAVFV